MVAMTYFHAEKCCYLAAEREASSRPLSSSMDSSWPSCLLCYINQLYKL